MTGETSMTNVFHFTFLFMDMEKKLPLVVPETYHEVKVKSIIGNSSNLLNLGNDVPDRKKTFQ